MSAEHLAVYRVPGPRGARLILRHGNRTLDLSALLEERCPELAHDPLVLAKAGFFRREDLAARLDGPGWRSIELPTELLLPVERAGVGKILALGKNFAAHAREFDEAVPEEPLFFNKLPETLVPHGATVRVPAWYDRRVDHEAELALVIGHSGRDIERARAFDHVAGYTVANDLTARSLQGRDRELGHPWLRSKNLDGFCPLGPCFVPRDWLDVSDLRVTATVNGEPRQDATTADWVVDVPHALEHLSRHLTLREGDLLLMGTPAGVGPLEDGDRVVCAVEGVGELETTIAR